MKKLTILAIVFATTAMLIPQSAEAGGLLGGLFGFGRARSNVCVTPQRTRVEVVRDRDSGLRDILLLQALQDRRERRSDVEALDRAVFLRALQDRRAACPQPVQANGNAACEQLGQIIIQNQQTRSAEHLAIIEAINSLKENGNGPVVLPVEPAGIQRTRFIRVR